MHNLMRAFAGESQARNKYSYYASKAKKDGYVQIAKIFEETANNEKEHAKIWWKLLTDGGAKSTAENLKDAAGNKLDNKIWAVGANYAFDKNVGLKAAYLKGDVENVKGEDDGWYAALNYKGAKAAKAGSWGAYAGYYDMAASTMI